MSKNKEGMSGRERGPTRACTVSFTVWCLSRFNTRFGRTKNKLKCGNIGVKRWHFPLKGCFKVLAGIAVSPCQSAAFVSICPVLISGSCLPGAKLLILGLVFNSFNKTNVQFFNNSTVLPTAGVMSDMSGECRLKSTFLLPLKQVFATSQSLVFCRVY